jgi:hypothetical protein
MFDTERKDVVTSAKCYAAEESKQQKDWYAIALRRHPEIVLDLDLYSLTRAWITARLLLPEILSGDLAFRTMPEKEVDELRTGR